MSTYKAALPEVFPYRFIGSHEEITGYVIALLNPYRPDVPRGSSFAVTTDNSDGTWNLWLSEYSHRYLHSLHNRSQSRHGSEPTALWSQRARAG